MMNTRQKMQLLEPLTLLGHLPHSKVDFRALAGHLGAKKRRLIAKEDIVELETVGKSKELDLT